MTRAALWPCQILSSWTLAQEITARSSRHHTRPKRFQNGLTSNEITSETQDSPKVKDENAKQAISSAHNDAEKTRQADGDDRYWAPQIVFGYKRFLHWADTAQLCNSSATFETKIQRYRRRGWSILPQFSAKIETAHATGEGRMYAFKWNNCCFMQNIQAKRRKLARHLANHIVNMTNSVQQSSFLNGCPPALEESASKRTLNAAHSDG